MSREVRRVPLDWQHPMVWREQWDRAEGRSRMQMVPKGLCRDFSGALADWESEGSDLAKRAGSHWAFNREYHLTGYRGQDDSAPVVHPFYVSDDESVMVRDEDHLHALMTSQHDEERPDPDDYMPVFPEGTATGWCMYETTSEGTPISPVFDDPDALAHWLADTEASAFGSMTATYEQWRAMVDDGWAPSAVGTAAGLRSGVEFVAGTR